MASRPIVSYDDITPPYDVSASKSQPPARKRKRNNKKAAPPPPAEEGHELTHEEIWDDSALIDAWNAAMEEYEAFNGPDKGWQKEPVHKSPLWYNVPPKSTSKPPPSPAVDNGEETDSQPINFDTFVPTHDPTLSAAIEYAPEGGAYNYIPGVSQDEAFERALQASYWSGYWTAVYHTLSQSKTNTDAVVEEEENDEGDNSEEDGDDENGDIEEFVSTQR